MFVLGARRSNKSEKGAPRHEASQVGQPVPTQPRKGGVPLPRGQTVEGSPLKPNSQLVQRRKKETKKDSTAQPARGRSQLSSSVPHAPEYLGNGMTPRRPKEPTFQFVPCAMVWNKGTPRPLRPHVRQSRAPRDQPVRPSPWPGTNGRCMSEGEPGEPCRQLGCLAAPALPLRAKIMRGGRRLESGSGGDSDNVCRRLRHCSAGCRINNPEQA